MKTTTVDAYSHQEVPFERVVDAVVKERDMSRNPLFQVMFVLQNTPDVSVLSLGSLDISAYNIGHKTSRFDITYTFKELSDGLHVSVEYNTDLYGPDTIERMIRHYKELLRSVVSNPEAINSELVNVKPGRRRNITRRI